MRNKLIFRFICGLIVVAIVASIFGISQYIAIRQTAVRSSDKPIIIIDAGHGGEDGGAIGYNGTIEKNINLKIALNLKALVSSSGYHVVMTRESDISIHDSNANTLGKKKKSDLRNRLAITREYDNAILLSIHQNKFSESKYSGAQVFYGTKNEKSKVLAECVQKSFVNNLQKDNTRKIKPVTSDIFLLHETKLVAILTECGFLSNPQEEALLASEEYQKKVAFTIYCGLLDYLIQEGKKV